MAAGASRLPPHRPVVLWRRAIASAGLYSRTAARSASRRAASRASRGTISAYARYWIGMLAASNSQERGRRWALGNSNGAPDGETNRITPVKTAAKLWRGCRAGKSAAPDLDLQSRLFL